MARRVVAIRRRVPADQADAYRRAWEAARAAVETEGSHAWAFRRRDDPAERIEFLEFAEGADPRMAPPVEAALAALQAAHGGDTEDWEEAG